MCTAHCGSPAHGSDGSGTSLGFQRGRTRLAQALAAVDTRDETRALLERYLGRARAELAEDAATAAWEEGRRTRFEHAIALALDARGPDAERDM